MLTFEGGSFILLLLDGCPVDRQEQIRRRGSWVSYLEKG